MANLIPESQRKYLELLMQDYPEYKAGLFESTADEPSFEDIFATPRGPLYNVQPTTEQLESGAAYYDKGDVDVATYAPKGPLYDVDPQRSAEIYESLDSEAAEKFAETFNFRGGESLSQNIYDPGVADSYSEWQVKDWEMPEKKFAGNVNIKDMEAWGSTPGTYKDEASRISLQKNLMDLVGTKPTSPRNEEKIRSMVNDQGKKVYVSDVFNDFSTAYPKDINEFAAGVLGHEYRHNLLEGPGFEKIRAEAMDINPNKLFANPKSVEYLPSVYESGAYKDADDHLKEELFNEAADMYNQYLMNKSMSGILANQNTSWMNTNLNPFYRPNQKFKHGSGSMDYFNKMLPTIKKYFAEVDRQGAMGPVNKAKLQVGMPENLSFNTGAGNIPTPKKTITPRHAPHPDRGGGPKRGSMPTGTAGRNPWGRAHGGLIDIPLPGRSRDI